MYDRKKKRTNEFTVLPCTVPHTFKMKCGEVAMVLVAMVVVVVVEIENGGAGG